MWNEVYIEWQWYIIDNAHHKEKDSFKYNEVPNTYFIREWKWFRNLEDIWEGNTIN